MHTPHHPVVTPDLTSGPVVTPAIPTDFMKFFGPAIRIMIREKRYVRAQHRHSSHH
jgi:hypothetical protein